MIDAIKKTLLAGVGAAVLTRERVDAVLGNLVQQGKMSASDAREIAERLSAEGRREFESLSETLSERLHGAFAGIDGRAQQRIDALEARVAALEQAVAAAATRAADAVEPPSRD